MQKQTNALIRGAFISCCDIAANIYMHTRLQSAKSRRERRRHTALCNQYVVTAVQPDTLGAIPPMQIGLHLFLHQVAAELCMFLKANCSYTHVTHSVNLETMEVIAICLVSTKAGTQRKSNQF